MLTNTAVRFYTPSGEVCMEGGIYTREKCPKCGKSLKHIDGRKGCFCPTHPDIRASSFIVKFPGGIYQRHKSYEGAAQSLNYLRHEKGSRKSCFNPDDYRSVKPNSFSALKEKYLARKTDRVTYKKIERIINLASGYFGPMNVREITGADIEDYLYSIKGISEKTRSNHCTQLHNFWFWCLARGNIITLAEMPTFPKIDYELGYRKITTWEIQESVIAKVKEISYHINPKIWFGIDMLANYTSLRPDDLRRISEGSLDNNGWLTIHNPTKKKNKFKYIKLHPDHVEEWRNIQLKYPAMSGVPFFRHISGIGGSRPNEIFGDKYLYKYWDKGCKEVGLIGVPLYPGTKHTTATETAKYMGTDKAKNASGLTNKAFERYCQVENTDAFEVVTEIRKRKKGKIMAFKK
jgi:hypothetical protein